MELSMRRSSTTSTTNPGANAVYNSGSTYANQSANVNASSKGSSATTNPYASQVTSIREVTSINSMTSFLSTNSLTDGLDRHTDKSMDRVETTNDLNTSYDNNVNNNMGVVVPLCDIWVFQSTIPLSEQALSADLLVTNSTKSDTTNATTEVNVVTLERQDASMFRVALYDVSLCNSDQTVALNLLSREKYESIYPNITSAGATIQLWNNVTKQERVRFSLTVLEQQGGAHKATTSSTTVTSEQLPVLTMYKVQSVNEDKWIVEPPTVYNCIPTTNSSLMLDVSSTSTQSPTMLLSLPETNTSPTTMSLSGNAIFVQLRTYTTTITNNPLYIDHAGAFDCSITPSQTNKHSAVYRHANDTVNVLELFALVLNALEMQTTVNTVKPDTLTVTFSTRLRELCNNMVHDRERELFELIDTVYAHYKCAPLADTLLSNLRQYFTILSGNNSSASGSTWSYFDPSVSPYANRALQLLVLLNNTNTNAATTSTSTLNTSASTDSATLNATAFKLSGCVVANLLFSEQNKLLALLVPSPSGANNTDTSNDGSDGSLVHTFHALLRGDNNNTSSPTKVNSDSFTNNNSYINFTATTDTSVSSILTMDILSYITSIHAALWMHDVTPLLDVIYKHAMASFRKHKSSIQVHSLFNYVITIIKQSS